MGARTLAQLENNLGALEVRLTDDQRARLEKSSVIELGFPHEFLARPVSPSGAGDHPVVWKFPGSPLS